MSVNRAKFIIAMAMGLALVAGQAVACHSSASASGPQQYNGDGTPLAAGGTTDGAMLETVLLRGTSYNCSCVTRRIQFEVREENQSWTSSPTHQSNSVYTCGNYTHPNTTVSNLTPGTSYKWRMRMYNQNYGTYSGWVSYNGGQAAFTVFQDVPASSATTILVTILAIMGLTVVVGRFGK